MSEQELTTLIKYIDLKFTGIEFLLQTIIARLYGEENCDKIIDIVNSELDEKRKTLEEKDIGK